MDCLDPVDAAKRILSGKRRFVDVLECNSNDDVYYAFNLVGWGMPTDINNLAESLRWLGTQRYNIATLIEVMRNSKRFAKLSINGETISNDFAFIIACNTIHVGKGMKMAPKASIDDGLVDIIIVPKVNRIKLLKLFPKLFTGEHINSPYLEYKQVNSFSIVPNENNKLNIDGELLGTTPVKVKVLNKEIEVLI
jgi:diacylglycerol kinase family enzyme